jgi:hypothetical protein
MNTCHRTEPAFDKQFPRVFTRSADKIESLAALLLWCRPTMQLSSLTVCYDTTASTAMSVTGDIAVSESNKIGDVRISGGTNLWCENIHKDPFLFYFSSYTLCEF